MPETRTDTYEVYTAEELRDLGTKAFDRALNKYAEVEWEGTWIVESCLDDFENNVLTSAGLVLDSSGDERRYPDIEYSIGNYGDYATLGHRSVLYVTDWNAFLWTLAGRNNDARDYFDGLPIVTLDRRTRLAHALLSGDADLRIESSDYGTSGRILATVEDNTQAGDLDTDAFERAVADWTYQLLNRIPSHVMEEYEYQTTPEAFLEAADANEWRFRADGTIA